MTPNFVRKMLSSYPSAESQLDLSERTYHVVHDSRTVEYSFGCNQSSDGSTRSSESSGSGSVQDMQESNKDYVASLNHQQVKECLCVFAHCTCNYIIVRASKLHVCVCIPLVHSTCAFHLWHVFPCLHNVLVRILHS